MTDRLLRESAPPAGMLASPVPQVWDPTANGGAGGYVRVYGEHNAPRSILYGPNGQPIGQDNPLEMRGRHLETLVGALTDDAATAGGTGSLSAKLRRLSDDLNTLLTRLGEVQETPTQYTLLARIAQLEANLELLKSMFDNGQAKVALSGQKVEEVKTQADAVNGVVTFASPIAAVEILNLDSGNNGVFTVNGLSLTVPRGSAYRSYIGGTPGTTVSVAGSTQYEIRRLV